jgi:hypothetical protein
MKSEPVEETREMRPDRAMTPSITKIENKSTASSSLNPRISDIAHTCARETKAIISSRRSLRRRFFELSKNKELIKKKRVGNTKTHGRGLGGKNIERLLLIGSKRV